MSASQTKPELLAPAGNWDCLRAAWENGADAVYFGIDSGFNARARAKNFSIDETVHAIEELHRRGLKGYVTLNTLAFTSELAEVETLIRNLVCANVDAILVQDLGVARLARAICPELPIHASTQMTLTSAQCIAVAAELGLSRVVLSREMSLDEIRRIARETTVPLEVFVHGALCVAYSGQCLTSESLGGRSANRGQCAQACRMPYELVCDGRDVDLGDQRYLLSPQDLAVFSLIPELIEAGICSFKIEGRLKTPEYVANITRHYRQAIDRACEDLPIDFSPRQVYEMEMSFSRGFSPGWMEGCDHKRLVPGLSSTKRGVLLGRVRSVSHQGAEIDLCAPIARGDGVVFEGDRFRGQEQGGRVYQVYVDGIDRTDEVVACVVELRFDRHGVDLNRLWVGQSIWKTDDPRLNARLRASFETADAQRRLAVDIFVFARPGERLVLRANAVDPGDTKDLGGTPRVFDGRGRGVEIISDEPLQVAEKHPLTEQTLREQFGRLGSTIYRLREVVADIQGNPMVPLSVLGKLRREMIARLDCRTLPPRPIAATPVLPDLRQDFPHPNQPTERPQAMALVRNLAQLDACLQAGVKHINVDLQDIREFRLATERAHSAGTEIWLATPRIQKPAEMGIFRAMLKHRANGVLVRNLAGLAFFASQNVPVCVDFSLNVANELTAKFLIERGATRLTPSYDLNRDKLLDLVGAIPPAWLEVVVHQHMPMFHMEHCVFCAVLSPGTNKTNCGRPCDRHAVKLRDQLGVEHPLTADVGCRNTLFNAARQSGAEIVPRLIECGVRHFRLEFLDEAPSEVVSTIDLYRRLLAGEVRGRDVWTALKATNQVGVTRGTLEAKRNPLAII